MQFLNLSPSIEVLYIQGQENLEHRCLGFLYSPDVTVNEWVLAARSHAKLSQEKLGEHVGVSKSNVSGWEKARHNPSFEQMVVISKVTNFPLPAGATPPSNVAPAALGGVRIPLISHVQAGVWTEVIDNFQPGDADEWLVADLEVSPSTFALQIKGDSMLPEFKPGDRVIIDPDVTPQPGDFVVAKNGDDGATFKKYRPRGLGANGQPVFELAPLNDDYPTLRSDTQPIKIIGTMVEHRRPRRPR